MRRFLFLAGAVVLLLMLPRTIQRAMTVAHSHSELIAKRIYAYRDWQSTGVRIDQGDLVEIEAQGEWLYTPDEYHGAGGAPYLSRAQLLPHFERVRRRAHRAHRRKRTPLRRRRGR